MIPPGTFIPLAEESGLIIPMGEWILREACREAASWPKPLQIAINLSPVQFRHGDLPALVHSVLLETGLAPSRLELEITEGVLIGDFSRAVSILRRLKALGVRIAMDDFGTGYSSLSYLQSFPFDKIKIDQAFISNLERNPQSATIVRAVIGLARGLDLPVLAEGVETEDQLAFLRQGSLRRGAGLPDRPAAADRGLCRADRPRRSKPPASEASRRARRAERAAPLIRNAAVGAVHAPRSRRCQASPLCQARRTLRVSQGAHRHAQLHARDLSIRQRARAPASRSATSCSTPRR